MKISGLAKNSIYFNFNLFSHETPYVQPGFFINYYIIARRAHYSIVNPFSVSDTISRFFLVLKSIKGENKDFSMWVFSFYFKHTSLALWFSWSIGASLYARLDRNLAVISNNGQIISAAGMLATRMFMNFIGVDVAFVLSSKKDGGRASLLTKRSILTIGFDGSVNWTYAFVLPGTKSTKTALLYSRIFNILISKLHNDFN